MTETVRNNFVRRLLILLAFTLPIVLWSGLAAQAKAPPNVVLIVTDDQPINTLQKMPNVRALAHRGMTFNQAVVSNPLCCPSRATILTGLYSGHTGVWLNGDGNVKWGGWPAFRRNGRNNDGTLFNGTGNNEARTLAFYLQNAGYKTGLFGKYLNHYYAGASAPPIPQGWSTWHSFIGSNGAYYDYIASDNGVLHHHGTKRWDYSTNVFGRKARDFLRAPDIRRGTRPFFMLYAPYAPHGAVTPARRDLDVRAPRPFTSGAYNERIVRDKPRYVRRTPRLTVWEHRRLANVWDRTYGTLRSVDRWVGKFRRALRAKVRRRTIFVFTSDNGQEWGDHRLEGKLHAYERSIRVPLIFAGPGIVHGSTGVPAVNADLMPTILDLVGHRVGGPYDGLSLRPVLHGGSVSRGLVLLEHLEYHYIPSYCGVRGRGWKYVLYRDGFQELYSLKRDPFELSNIARRRPALRHRLRLRALKLCQPRPPDW